MKLLRVALGALLLVAFTTMALLASGTPAPEPPGDPTAFVRQGHPPIRGRILAVVTSTATYGPKKKNAGFELTELSRAAYVFQANGFEVDIASTKGGRAPMKLDGDDMEAIDHAFLADPAYAPKLASTLPLDAVDPARYAAVYFVGGKGTMWDFPDHPAVHRLVKHHLDHGVVGAVCHGPAALLHVKDHTGKALVAGRRITGFTNAEERFLIKKADQIFPFLLQDRATQVGARFEEGPLYLDHCVVDGRLVTGQNPWSTWSVAEQMVRALGHTPVARPETPAEKSVRILATFHAKGFQEAKALRKATSGYLPRLIQMHALVAFMQGRLGAAWALYRLA